MSGSVLKRSEFIWVQDVRANYVCIHNGKHMATVFAVPWERLWHVVVYVPCESLVQTLPLRDVQRAMSVAEALIKGRGDESVIGRQVVPDFHEFYSH